jgi:Na+-translocating ferredoxin:NAD+ oxidoreductase RnfG subunit
VPKKLRKAHIPDFSPRAEKFAAEAHALAEKNIKAFAEEEAARFRTAIMRQSFPAFRQNPLAESTLAIKASKGLDHRVMMANKHYVKSIKVFRTELPDGVVQFRVGFAENALAKDYDGKFTDVLLSEVARIHEYGSEAAKIPARSHWRPHLRLMEQRSSILRRTILDQTVKLGRRRMGGS